VIDWNAPDYAAVLEHHLRWARLEMMEDPRLDDAGETGTSAAFAARLIQEKIGAAASTGLRAVESSLRVNAQAAMQEQGVEVGQARQILDAAGEAFRAPKVAGLPALEPETLSPAAMAACAFGASVLGALAVFLLVPAHPALLVLYLGAAPIVALIAHGARTTRLRRAQQRVVREYPSELCRQYMQAMRESVARYEGAVRNAPATREPALHA
jgi:hypothetical protein